ncbi:MULTISPECIES: hypothetical protein [Pseudonocardia]|uniref:Uncharacterized protein n=2 Tax=Pseudonocardia TaxID=1847 RepID=A0A1Y2MS43_PSEAH|nr:MULTISPECIES: hypothetical protein [Pseudonocardia]OSY37338.1 hypothetical protein BG845_04849 [Pseudonocardia autotrophica]TDN72365.1 hypothetical protein C8E95_1421 [Pseudonocardia autotrophica]BBG03075.1 hypothetical protein Pdca_42840 [Pseudonocardia autotrophica]GEC23695.1 hypothetical protein PSA01_07240 [Pseudonocardia saturnea]
MLMLVLVLVAIALALWLAGWFLQVVALFWTSVGVCLIAGLVLFYDWWQTRSAVRAGDRSESTGAGPAPEHSGPARSQGPDIEPATQILPVVRPETGGAGRPGGPAAAGPGGTGGAPEAFDASDATIQIPVIRPSGSEDGPPAVSRSGGSLSRSVTESEAPAAEVLSDGRPSETGGETVAVGAAASPDAPDGSGPAAGNDAGRGGDPGRSGEPPSGDGRPAGVTGAGQSAPEGATGVPLQGSDRPPAGSAGVSRRDENTTATDAGSRAGAGEPGFGSGSPPAGTPGSGDTGRPGTAAPGAEADGAVPAPPSDRPGMPGEPVHGEAGRTTRAGATEFSAAAVPPGGSPPPGADDRSGASAAGNGGAAGAAQVAGAAAAGADAGRAPSDGGPAGAAGSEQQPVADDAPEEPRDPTLAGLVARLPDEVLVIDEHPRYHVQTCRALPGRAVIPLPVSEAVELGFTPCGWCSPNRSLGERHPAQVR